MLYYPVKTSLFCLCGQFKQECIGIVIELKTVFKVHDICRLSFECFEIGEENSSIVSRQVFLRIIAFIIILAAEILLSIFRFLNLLASL